MISPAESRYFAMGRIKVWHDECQSFQTHWQCQGHYMCSKCKTIMGFPAGGLSEPAHWSKELEHTMIYIPYMWDGNIYNEGNRVVTEHWAYRL